MDNTYWQQQQTNQALFDDLLWSKPEQKSAAGKLAIIGGNIHGFNSVSAIYNAAIKSGIGTVRTLLPDSLSKTVRKIWPECEFGPSTKSGSFSTKALDEWLAMSQWADGTIISGDIGHNSETTILLEKFIDLNKQQLTLVGDSVSVLTATPINLLENEHILLVVDLSQLQKLLIAIRYPTAVKSTMTIYQITELLHSLTFGYSCAIGLMFEQYILLSINGQVSSTPITKAITVLDLAAVGSVWRLQQPAKAYESITTGIYDLLTK